MSVSPSGLDHCLLNLPLSDTASRLVGNPLPNGTEMLAVAPTRTSLCTNFRRLVHLYSSVPYQIKLSW